MSTQPSSNPPPSSSNRTILDAAKRERIIALMAGRVKGRVPLGRKCDGEPGWITIWRGWQKLNALVRGAELAETIK
jgi:hypothetical protein